VRDCERFRCGRDSASRDCKRERGGSTKDGEDHICLFETNHWVQGPTIFASYLGRSLGEQLSTREAIKSNYHLIMCKVSLSALMGKIARKRTEIEDGLGVM